MGNYLRIARAYLRGRAVAVWLFLFVCLLSVCADDGELARHQGGILGGVLSRKSYMAMFAYFNACVLGVLLRDHIAHPWASVLPHYRQKHLLVTTLIALLFLGIPMFAMMFVGTSDVAPTSVAVIFLACLAAGLWTLHHPAGAFLVFPFLALVRAPSSDPDLADFLAGNNLPASAGLVFMSFLALWAFAWRLLGLNEDRLEYQVARVWGDFLRGPGQIFRGQAKTIADCLAALPADKRATLQNFDPLKNPFTNLKHVDNLSGYSERSLWQRLQLGRLGTAPTRVSVSVAYTAALALLFGLLLDAVVGFSVLVMNPMSMWQSWFNRRPRLGYESLRPRTRPEFVREVGLTLLGDMIQCWLWGVLFAGITAAIWAPKLLQGRNIVLFILGTGIGQLCIYAMAIWPSKRGVLSNGVWFSFTAICFYICPAGLMVRTLNGSIGVEVIMAIGSVLAAVSVATIALAYRRWCRVDLDWA